MRFPRSLSYFGLLFGLVLLADGASATKWARAQSNRLTVSDADKPTSTSIPAVRPNRLGAGAAITAADRGTNEAEGEPSVVDGRASTDEIPELPHELKELLGRLRVCLAYYFRQREDVADRSPWGIMHALLPFGVDSQVSVEGRKVNAIGWLCWNGTCQGLQLFQARNGQLEPRLGPGLQGHTSQFLFMMALSKVPADYPMKVDGYDFTLADLVRYEKRSCESGGELNFKLVGLVHYLGPDATWVNREGERWDIPRLIKEELAQPVVGATCGGTHRMMGFSYAVRKREQRRQPIEGQWLRAKKYVDEYHEYAFRLQNPDGSFSTNWFKGRASSGDPDRVLETTGHTLEWLVFSMPTDQLTAPRVVKSVDFLTRLLLDNRQRTWGVGPKGHALHALALYDERLMGTKPGKRPFLIAAE